MCVLPPAVAVVCLCAQHLQFGAFYSRYAKASVFARRQQHTIQNNIAQSRWCGTGSWVDKQNNATGFHGSTPTRTAAHFICTPLSKDNKN